MNFALVQAFAQKQLKDETTGHDIWHGQRVAHLGQAMYRQDHPEALQTASLDIIQSAGLIHDTIDEKVCSNIESTLAELKQVLIDAGFNQSARENIVYTITHMSYSKNLAHHYALSIEGQYVQDADRIEALGAIGIARAFTYGGRLGNRIYDPRIKPVKLVNHDQYRHHVETTLNHFYEKLFQLESTMNTPSGQRLAQQRTQYMKAFVAQFMAEWAGKLS